MTLGTTQSQRTTSLLLVFLMLLTALVGTLPTGGPNMPKLPQIPVMNATIKTQPAADAVPNGLKGIDVSEYQGDSIDWEKVKASGVQFVMIRATIGMKEDKYFYANVAGAQAAGLYVGAYHYAKYKDEKSMQEEAEFFISVLKNVKLDYPAVLDLELHNGLSKNKLTELSVGFMDKVKAAGHTVMFYSYTNFIKDRLNVSMLDGYNFWVANYMEEPSQDQKIWQYSSKGSISGIKGDVDLNVAYTDMRIKRGVRVNKTISDSIKRTLNERHGAGLDMDGLDLKVMKVAVNTILQSELNRQLGLNLDITGEMDADTLNALELVPFNYGQTKGNITYLVQVMLFYKGYYTEPLTGAYDEHTLEALELFQYDLELDITGTMTRETLWYLFR